MELGSGERLVYNDKGFFKRRTEIKIEKLKIVVKKLQ